MKPKETDDIEESRLTRKLTDAIILQPKKQQDAPEGDDESVHSCDFMYSPAPSPKKTDSVLNFKSVDRLISHWLNETVFKENKKAQFKVLKLEND